MKWHLHRKKPSGAENEARGKTMSDDIKTEIKVTPTRKRHEVKGVLPPNLAGGPQGLGDPDDKTLRKVEKDVLIPKKIREKTRREKCLNEFKAFAECGTKAGLLVVTRCREENKLVWSCAERWWNDKEFVAECTKEYLDERSEYRRTGVGAKYQRVGSSIHY